MVTWAPSIYQCGTIYPVWMRGTLPTIDEGEVNRTACIVGFYGKCSKTLNIRVKNCGKYNVYHLVPVPQTSTGYCIGENTHCPLGQSSISGFTPCVDVVPVNTNPAVNASLENKIFDINGFQSLEPVFKCLFDEPDGSPYWYDTYWYINTDTVKVVESQLYMSNQSWLYPTDWVQKYNLNMVVKCSVRVRHLKESIPGHHNYSDNFQAGMFPSSYSYGVHEGDTISIMFTVTVPVGCLDITRQSHCETSIYILTPEYQSSPSSCQNFNKQGDIIFNNNGCGIIIESSTWWEKKILNVTGKADGLINAKDRDVYIKLGSGTESKLDISGVWYNFTMPDIKVFLYDEDKKLKNKHCLARTDPRMTTFDGKIWTASLAGEFVMYKDNRRKIAVHALFSCCSTSERLIFPPCVCGIAVRVEDSLFVYRTCAEISYRISKPLIHHDTVYHICDSRHMVVEPGKVTLPNGAIVFYTVEDDLISEIRVTPSIFDEDNIEGLCGNPNDNTTDDFTIQGSNTITYNITEFQASWSVDIQSTESLFGINTILKRTNAELQKYCDCATEQGPSENSISGHYTANCSVATEAVLCSRTNTSQPFTSICESYQNRYKRDVNELNIRSHIARRSVDSDDVLEAQPLSLDPTFDPNFIPPAPSWKNGWTESAAREHCENIFIKNPARTDCQKYISVEKSTNVAIEECVLDIRDSGTTEFLKYTLGSVNQICFEEVKRYEVFNIKRDSEDLTVVEQIGKIVCQNNCSSNGECNGGVCKCSSSYIGMDCSHAKSIPPMNFSLPENGVCKTSQRACTKTNIFGHFHSENVMAKLEEFHIADSGRLNMLSTYDIQTTYINPTVLRINFPTNPRRQQSSFTNVYASGYYISLSYDETNYSDSLALVIYNDLCYSCNASTMECNMTSTCNPFRGITQKPKNTVENGYFLPLIISLCAICVLIIGTITGLILMKRRLTGHFSPWCVDMKKLQLPNHPPVQCYYTIDLDLKKSTSQNYETLKLPVVGRSNAAFEG